MTKAEIINRITEQYEAKLDAFDKMLKVLKDYKIEYKLDSVSFWEDRDFEEYQIAVETNDGGIVNVRLTDESGYITWYDDFQKYIKKERVY